MMMMLLLLLRLMLFQSRAVVAGVGLQTAILAARKDGS